MSLLTVRTAFWRHIKRQRLKSVGSSLFSEQLIRNMAASAGKPRPFRVSIEGNIGSGKSTCLQYFSKWERVEIHPEPIEQWRNVSGHNLLGLLYSDLETWNYPFQHYVHLSRLKIQTSPPISDKTQVKMFERSVQNGRYCFTETALRNNFLTECEFSILKSWYEWAEQNTDITLDLIVYLRTTPEVVWSRMMKRGRNEEATVPLEYLKEVHASYEKWLNNPEQVSCKVLTVDADQDLDAVVEQLERYTPVILGMEQNSLQAQAGA